MDPSSGGGFAELGIKDSETIVREKLNNAFDNSNNSNKFYYYFDKTKEAEKIVLMIDNTIKVLKESKSWKEVDRAEIFPSMKFLVFFFLYSICDILFFFTIFQ